MFQTPPGNLGVLISVSQARWLVTGVTSRGELLIMKLQSFVRAFVPALVVALIGFIGAPRGLAAQSPLAASEAAAFMGNWTLNLESPQGAFEQTLVLKDANGKVAGEISNQLQPGALEITDISKAGADLILKFTGDFQGQ